MSRTESLAPLTWSSDILDKGRLQAIAYFRESRVKEPLEAYLDVFDEYQATVETLLEQTIDLTKLDDEALGVLSDPKLQEAFRYLAGPPISLDDLKVVADVERLSPKQLKANPGLVARLIDAVRLGLDRRRFPWVIEGREATARERNAAVLASAALMASQRVATMRRSEGKSSQEQLARKTLLARKFVEVPPRTVRVLADGPKPGEFCMESVLGTRKADLLVGLFDRRIMPIECKVSNSATNSIKRLNNDAAVKAHSWRSDFGRDQVVPVAILSGVYKLKHLEDAQARGLMLVWAHELNTLIRWISATRPAGA